MQHGRHGLYDYLVAAEKTYPNVVVIIPALNEESSLGQVLRDLPAVSRVIVVDNGSTDATARVAVENGAHVIRESQRGYGAACLAGLGELAQLVKSGQQSCEVVAFVDADYSDHVHLLPELIDPIESGE